MSLTENQKEILRQKEEVKKRINTQVDPDNYEFFPAKKQVDYYDNDVEQRVAIYVRVSTGDVKQTTSYELQKKYYEEFVVRHPCWKLVRIYADEGISGTSRKNRKDFNQMIDDCKTGKIDMIITKSVSRFARNILDCIGMVQNLSQLDPPVGVFFETECIFSLNDDSSMALSFQATMAQEESHSKSRSMEASLRMRLDHGIPLTPDRLGLRKNKESGRLAIYEDEASTVKLAFYMYLYGYSTQEIADKFIELGLKTRPGNIKWTSSSITQILRSERYCGDVRTRKTFTPSYLDHKTKKNRGERPQSHYRDWHEAIISRDDFLAVQRLLDNAKYGNKSILPQPQVITEGLLKGFVVINPTWGGFSEQDYYTVSNRAYMSENGTPMPPTEEDSHEIAITIEAGDFDMRGFQVTRGEFLESYRAPSMIFNDRTLKFSTECVRKFPNTKYVELLFHPRDKKFAVRPTSKDNRNAIVWSKITDNVFVPRDIAFSAPISTLYAILGWSPNMKYRMFGELYQTDTEQAYLFDAAYASAYVKSYMIPSGDETGEITPLFVSGKHVQVMPQEWADSFGEQYYDHLQDKLGNEAAQTDDLWKIQTEGHSVEIGTPLHVTSNDELERYIFEQFNSKKEEVHHDDE